MGSRTRIHPRVFYVDVFAADKAQRDEYSYKLVDELENNIPVYNYDEGFPPTVIPSQIGALDIDEIVVKIIKIIPGLTEKMYYRAVVQFSALYQVN